MTPYSELFPIGQGFDAFAAAGLPAERATVAQARQTLDTAGISEATLQRLASLKGTYHLLAAGEMWCPDCQLNLAALDYLCRVQPRVRLGIITKARAEQALRERLGLEKVSIPLVVVLSADFEQIGLFVERPQAVIDGGEAVLAAYKAGQCLEATLTDVLALLESAELAA